MSVHQTPAPSYKESKYVAASFLDHMTKSRRLASIDEPRSD